jgi:hypothetical protein
MKSVKEVIDTPVISPWRGSEKTCEMVREQIRERWGEEAAEAFDPQKDAMPLPSWARYGYRVRQGEKALKSVTFVESEDEDGGPTQKIRRTVNIFFKNQVEKVEA